MWKTFRVMIVVKKQTNKQKQKDYEREETSHSKWSDIEPTEVQGWVSM